MKEYREKRCSEQNAGAKYLELLENGKSKMQAII